MARSFYYGTEATLLSGSRNFALSIVQTPEAFGLTQEMADSYALIAQAYADSYSATTAPTTRTPVMLTEKSLRKRELRRATATISKIINGAPGVTTEQKLSLGLSIPHDPAPTQPPGMPEAFRADLAEIGSLTLRWQCDHPSRRGGVIYLISRRTGDDGEFVHLGFTGKKRFVDASIPPGATVLTYQVQAARSNSAGSPARYTVRFGTGQLPTTMLRSMPGATAQRAA